MLSSFWQTVVVVVACSGLLYGILNLVYSHATEIAKLLF